MIVRWLGAFKKSGDLTSSLIFELAPASDLRCAEIIRKGSPSQIKSAVGLLVASSALVRRYNSDVYSVRDGKRLRQTRPEGAAYSSHTEAWVRPEYIGIVVKSRESAGLISRETWATIRETAGRHNLPVYRLTRAGQLEEILP